jgi:hypothetical protein
MKENLSYREMLHINLEARNKNMVCSYAKFLYLKALVNVSGSV